MAFIKLIQYMGGLGLKQIEGSGINHIKDKLELGYEYLGDHEVENIKDPVRVYKV